MTTGYVELENGKIYYEMEGKGEALVLCHAGFVDSRMWDGQWDSFSQLQIRLWVDGIYRQPKQVDPDVRQRAAEMNRITVKNGTWAVADAQPLNPLNPPAVERLAELKVPTLVIAGSLDHPEVLRAADLLANRIKGAKKNIFSDCAHVPNMEKPAEFNRTVIDFLKQQG